MQLVSSVLRGLADILRTRSTVRGLAVEPLPLTLPNFHACLTEMTGMLGLRNRNPRVTS